MNWNDSGHDGASYGGGIFWGGWLTADGRHTTCGSAPLSASAIMILEQMKKTDQMESRKT